MAPTSAAGGQEPVYMSPLEPPLSVYAPGGGAAVGPAVGTISSDGGFSSIYGTMPRSMRMNNIGRRQYYHHQDVVGSEFTAPPQMIRFPTQYATLRKEKLGARPSLRSLGLMDEKEEEEDKVRVLEDMEGEHDSDSDDSHDTISSNSQAGTSPSLASLKEKLKDENLSRITRGITFQTLKRGNEAEFGGKIGSTTSVAKTTLHIQTRANVHNTAVVLVYKLLFITTYTSQIFRFNCYANIKLSETFHT